MNTSISQNRNFVLEYMLDSERKLKHLFVVFSICSLIDLPLVLYIIMTEEWETGSYFLIMVTVVVLICLAGLGWTYYSSRQSRLHYEKTLNEREKSISNKKLIEKVREKVRRKAEASS